MSSVPAPDPKSSKSSKISKAPKGMKIAVERFTAPANRRLVAKNLKASRKITNTKNIVAYDPKTSKYIYGNLSQVAKQIKSNPNTIKSRIKEGHKQQFQDIKGYTILSFKDPEKMIEFKNSLVQDVPKPKKKWEPIVEGMSYLEASQPTYTLKKGLKVDNKFWGTAEQRFNIDVKDKGLTETAVESIFKESIESVKKSQKLKGKDKMRVIIEDPDLKFFVSTKLMNADEIEALDVQELIEEVVESNQDWSVGVNTTINVVSINLPDGAGGSNFHTGWKGGSSKTIDPLIDKNDNPIITDYKLKEQAQKKFNKKSIIQINNPNDDLCCARAIGLGIVRNELGTASAEYKQMLMDRKRSQYKRAKLLHKKAGIPRGKCGLEEIKIFEKSTGYNITVIDGDFMNQVVYPNISSSNYEPAEDDNKNIYLYKTGDHFDLIASNRVAGFFSKDHFCHRCKQTYKDKGKHKCRFKCNMCCRSDCPVLKTSIHDRKYDIHCKSCNRYFCDPVCFANHQTPDDNGATICGKMWKCHCCSKVMDKIKFPPKTHKCGDYECSNCGKIVPENHECYMFPKPYKDASTKYIFFDFEADISDTTHKVMFSISQYFDDPEPIEHSTIEEFCEWAFQKEHKGYTFIAHNGRGYDYKFIIRWIFDNTEYKPFTIFAGAKIMCMSVKELSIRFIDSLSFLTMPLKAFPKTFGLKELKKGFFPHWFNTKENWSYEGPMPDKEEFRYNSFKEKDRKEFLEWYEGKIKENYVWNQMREMKEYCISDVDILRRCCIKFRQLYLELAGIDPFQYLTIASVCMSIYKYNFIDESFPMRYTQFKKKWGKYMKGGNPKDIPAEYKVAKNEFEKETHRIVFKQKKIGLFKYKDVEWFRQAFFGGRTNAVKLLYHFKEGEEGKYSDITSLYPTVNFYDKYPKGHFTKIEEADIKEEDYEKVKKGEYFGFVDCEIDPPKNLYHPVLPVKGEKLVFDLEQKRGVWCSNEIQKAVEKGYTIKKIYEIRYFKGQTRNLFKGYVKWFLKVKQESSGYPDWVKTETDKDLYIEQYEKRQGIKLDKEKICVNPGLRAIAKLCLNSLWGKFGQRTNMSRTEIIDTKSAFYEIILNEQYENINWIELTNDKMEITYSIKDKYVENDFNTNIAVACFTTSSARLRLYQALDYLGEQILYFDTDSCVYKYNPDNPECNKKLENGDLLGEWTDELEGKKMIGTFVSGGPKNYSYETIKDGKTSYHTKVKGFSLNYEVSQQINHHTIIDLVKQTLEDPTIYEEIADKKEREEAQDKNKIAVSFDMIKRTKQHTLENVNMKKKYSLVYTKRNVLEPDEYGNYDTLPFGYDPNWKCGSSKDREKKSPSKYKMNQQHQDLQMGNWNEKKLIKYLNGLEENKDKQFSFFKNEFNTMDLFNEDSICELKSRRNNYSRYPTTMVGHNKICRALADESDKIYKFYFLFTDGLWVWDFDKDKFSVALGGRTDRGKDEIKEYAYIPISELVFLTDTIASNR